MNKVLTHYEEKEKRWTVLGQINDLGEYSRDYTNDRTGIIIPHGFQCDLASIPRILWSLLAPYELSEEAPILHDYLYKNAGLPIMIPTINGWLRVVDKDFADREFLYEMIAQNVPEWKRRSAYYAVKYFGRVAWEKHLKRNILKRG